MIADSGDLPIQHGEPSISRHLPMPAVSVHETLLIDQAMLGRITPAQINIISPEPGSLRLVDAPRVISHSVGDRTQSDSEGSSGPLVSHRCCHVSPGMWPASQGASRSRADVERAFCGDARKRGNIQPVQHFLP